MTGSDEAAAAADAILKEESVMKMNDTTRSRELTELCLCVRNLVAREEYDMCSDVICEAMGHYPCAPQPHNLLGVVLEKIGKHADAMRHFRAAMDLDPTYSPARQNLTTYGTFYSDGRAAYDENDCQESKAHYEIEYDHNGVGHMLRRKCS